MIKGNNSIGYNLAGSGKTDATGEYVIRKLPPGVYRIAFRTWSNPDYFGEYYDDAVDIASATSITVPAMSVVSGIDASLKTVSLITGKVTGPDGVTPLPAIDVKIYHQVAGKWEEIPRSVYPGTDAEGKYTIKGLEAGIYRVGFSDDLGNGYNGTYTQKFYSNGNTIDFATDIEVPAYSLVSGIDVSLGLASKISGKMTESDGVTPIVGGNASAWRFVGGAWESMYGATTDAEGNYTIPGLAAGTYRVWFINRDSGANHQWEYFDGFPDIANATDIVVAASETVTDIDVAWNASGYPAEPTRIIKVTGNMVFGSTPIGSSVQRTLMISNSGSASLAVTSISLPAGFSGSFTGSIAAGASKNVTVTFSPSALQSHGGTITVNSNASSGGNTRSVGGSGKSLLPPSTILVKLTSNRTKQSLEWSDVVGETGYLVEWQNKGKGPWKKLRTVGPNVLATTVSGKTQLASKFRVRAFNPSGSSNPTRAVKAKKAGVKEAPRDLADNLPRSGVDPGETATPVPAHAQVSVGSPTGSSFAEFAATHSLTANDALPGANPDNDWAPNALEFLLGLDPKLPNAVDPALYRVTHTGNEVLLDFKLAANLMITENGSSLDVANAAGDSPIRVTGQIANDPGGPWMDSRPLPIGGGIYRVTLPIGPGATGFCRLKFLDP